MKLAAFVVVGAVAIAGASCRPQQATPPDGAAATALRLFAAARRAPAAEPEIEALVDVAGAPGGRARLFDAVAALAEVPEPRAIATTSLDQGARVVVDLAADLPGGGSATYSVETKRAADGAWRVAGFWGPGVAWPDRALPSAEGLSVSPPPR